MRRILFLLLLMPSVLMAQVGEYRNDLAVGGSVGYVMSNVGFVPDVPQGFLKGMTAGLSVRYTCEKYFMSVCSIVAEVNITQTGWKEDILDVDILTTPIRRLHLATSGKSHTYRFHS